MATFDYPFLGKLTEWRKNRLQNFAEKKGIKYTQALQIMQDQPSLQHAVNLLDAVCDPEYHSSKKPHKYQTTSFT